MRISGLTVYRVSIPFRRSFGHALQWRDKTDTLVIGLQSDCGVTGWGEILPRPYLTGESIGGVLALELPEIVRRWYGRSFENREEVLQALHQELDRGSRSLAAIAGWELAVLDLAGKTFGFAAGDVLSKTIGPELEIGVVIGFDVTTEKLERHCQLLRLVGRRHIKVKVGLSDDIRRLEIVNRVFGPEVPIRIDANGAWAAEEAIATLRRMRHYNVCSVEQPVLAHDLEGMRKVREQTGMIVVADESLCNLADAHSLITARAADVFNIRIAKCGGLLASRNLVSLAKNMGISCQLGTLVGETGILSRASDIFGERIEGFEFVEGKQQNRRLLTQDIVEDAAVMGTAIPIHGLGVSVAPSTLSRWAASASGHPEGVQGEQHEYCQ